MLQELMWHFNYTDGCEWVEQSNDNVIAVSTSKPYPSGYVLDGDFYLTIKLINSIIGGFRRRFFSERDPSL